jgi:hypothetical protein
MDGYLGADFAYDRFGNLISRRAPVANASESRPSADDSQTWEVNEIDRNDAGEITAVRFRYEGRDAAMPEIIRTEVDYDANGYPAETRDYGIDDDGKESVNSRTQFRYDARGNVAEQKSWDADGDLDGWQRNSFDADGNLVLAEGLDGTGAVTERTVSVYENGRLVVETYENGKREPRHVEAGHSRKTCRYNDRGYLVEEVHSGFEGTKNVRRTVYDDLERRLSEEWVNEKGEPVAGPNGWARHKLTYRESTTSILTEQWEDAAGRPASEYKPYGYSTRRNEYDFRGALVAKVMSFPDGFTVRETKNAAEQTTALEYFDGAGAKAWTSDGYHLERMLRYHPSGKVIEVVTEDWDSSRFRFYRERAIKTWKDDDIAAAVLTYEDREGKPVGGPGGCLRADREYDANGRVVAVFISGCPASLGAAAVRAEIKWTRDGKMRERSWQALDSAGAPIPVSGIDRAARVVETYRDGLLRRVLSTGFSENACGYASAQVDFDAKGNVTAVRHERANGEAADSRAATRRGGAPSDQELQVGDVLVPVTVHRLILGSVLFGHWQFPGGCLKVARGGKPVTIDIRPGRFGVESVDW